MIQSYNISELFIQYRSIIASSHIFNKMRLNPFGKKVIPFIEFRNKMVSKMDFSVTGLNFYVIFIKLF